MKRTFFFLILLTSFLPKGKAQLDVEHFIPPLYSRIALADHCGAHYLVLATNVEESFYVSIFEGNVLIDSVKISQQHPYKYNLGYGQQAIGIIPTRKLNTVLIREGLHLKASSPFFAAIRHRAKHQGAALTSKGRYALGKRFRLGFLFSYDEDHTCNTCSNFCAVMATQDDTHVFISDIAKGIFFAKGEKAVTKEGEYVHFVLNKGESYVVAVHSDDLYTDANSLMGAHITATKPIAVNTGSWLARAPHTSLDHDIGFDQIIPERMLGKEYLFIKGEGVNELEKPVLIATKDGTTISINGKKYKKSIDAGEVLSLKGEDYTLDENLHITSSEPIYVYQNTAGAQGLMTAGLNLIPPIIPCSYNNMVRITDIKLVADSVVLQIIAQTGQEVRIIDVDRNELLFKANDTKSNVASKERSQWVTYKYNLPTYVNDVSIHSTGTINAGLCYHSAYLGAASYLSGHARGPILINKGNDFLSPYDTTVLHIINHEGYRSFKWFLDDELITTKDEPFLKVAKAGVYTVMGIVENDAQCSEVSVSDPYELYSEERKIHNTIEVNNLHAHDALFHASLVDHDHLIHYLVSPFYFGRDDASLDSLSLERLQKLVKELQALEGFQRIEVIGHSDCLGSDEYNQKLSLDRAKVVVEVLKKYGLADTQLMSKGMGAIQPYIDCQCEECTEEQHQKNRRVEIKLFYE